jgi:hypothetical protein
LHASAEMFVLRNVALIACMQCALQISLPTPKCNTPLHMNIFASTFSTSGDGKRRPLASVQKHDGHSFCLTRTLFPYILYIVDLLSPQYAAWFFVDEIVKKRKRAMNKYHQVWPASREAALAGQTRNYEGILPASQSYFRHSPLTSSQSDLRQNGYYHYMCLCCC